LDSFFKNMDKRPPTDEPPIWQSPKMSRNDDSSSSTFVWIFTIFIMERFFVVFIKERLFMLFKFTFTVYNS
jgi:hypothetical protein